MQVDSDADLVFGTVRKLSLKPFRFGKKNYFRNFPHKMFPDTENGVLAKLPKVFRQNCESFLLQNTKSLWQKNNFSKKLILPKNISEHVKNNFDNSAKFFARGNSSNCGDSSALKNCDTSTKI